MPEKIRAAVIGCGGRGRLYARLSQPMDDLDIVAYGDVKQESAEKTLAEYGGEYATEDLDRIWSDPSLDAVFICTWHETHTPFALKAAEAGKHIFMEKPLALTVAECETIGEAVAKAGVKLVSGFKLHCCPVVLAAMEKVGTPHLLTGQMMDGNWPSTHWACQPLTGGGNVLSQGCHTADLLCLMAGAEPVRVSGAGGTFTAAHPDIIDNVVATITFANGAVASLVQGDLGHNAYLSKFFFQAWGRNGVWAHLDSRLHRALIYSKGGQPEEITAAQMGLTEATEIEGDVGVVRAFVDAIAGHGPAEPGVEAGLRATKVVTGIFESIRTGQVIEL